MGEPRSPSTFAFSRLRGTSVSIPNWFAGSICHLLGIDDATARSVLTS
jgi:hypothetical protein